ncbi:MarR family winged helix-turn-helix transcriptional regulator [Paeniglutamicibacter cryotolerans]|uniref:DNA-binding MarR family transcriptional regulator n=1 Tax=Paeniglutamicibacter cryotolerans TaxID=670079 RepID=A0A839R080_9MICC|nr:MarR family transcriptional regulator [Paeniglutamicibacter cryotolerans]MBB2997651.1 DNA-binding MarR family transcriptional regulator [Paeniglutamicibacter cryotolerans]
MTDSSVPNLLAGDNLATWAALATVLEWLPAALDAPLVRDFDLTHFEYGILFALADAPNQMLRMTVLAGYANSSLSRLSRAVSRIEGRGWVQRSRDPLDGRSTLASLTEAGLAMVEKVTPVHSRTVTKLVLEPLTTAQRGQLRDISLRIQHAIREQESWRATSTFSSDTD